MQASFFFLPDAVAACWPAYAQMWQPAGLHTRAQLPVYLHNTRPNSSSAHRATPTTRGGVEAWCWRWVRCPPAPARQRRHPTALSLPLCTSHLCLEDDLPAACASALERARLPLAVVASCPGAAAVCCCCAAPPSSCPSSSSSISPSSRSSALDRDRSLLPRLGPSSGSYRLRSSACRLLPPWAVGPSPGATRRASSSYSSSVSAW